MLPDTQHLLFFLTATLLLNITPGSDVIYIATQSLQSHKHGLLAALGISIGASFYVIATAFGLTELIKNYPALYQVIKITGGMYLIYLAWQVFNSSLGDMHLSNNKFSSSKTFFRGIVNTILNPKVGIFFITFLPQFIEPSRGEVWLQLLSLGICFIISGTLINMIYALAFSQLKELIFSRIFIKKWLNKMTALVFGSIAIKVLFT